MAYRMHRMKRRRGKECEFTEQGITPDYKDVKRLQKYLTPQGKILPRRRTGVSAKMQRRLATAIKRARHLACYPQILPTCESKAKRNVRPGCGYYWPANADCD
ncbi:MAG: 30S ribosomal protein S18 [Chloroflexaceae bacterium]|nr:30S ribosomal protein S18 [Chloroflexaceae bacterium]